MKTILVNQTEAAHLVAGGVALGLIILGLALVLGRNRLREMAAATGLVLMALIWIAGCGTGRGTWGGRRDR